MPDQQMGPDRLVPRGLPGARRGYDREAVERLLHEAREAWAAQEEEHRRLLAEIDRAGGLQYLARDLGAVGEEVGRMLGEAQQAAQGLRERARADAAERVAAGAAAARRLVAEAEGQAFHLRADAWAAAEALLRQAGDAGRAMVAEAEAEVLVIRAEAEQEAYRLVTAARREAQDVVRGARFEAERTVLELQGQPERVLPVEPVPVETTAPEVPPGRSRRRRDTGEVPVVRPEDVIRVIQPPGARRAAPGAVDPGSYGDALAAEVEALRGSGEVEVASGAAAAAAAVEEAEPAASPQTPETGEKAAVTPEPDAGRGEKPSAALIRPGESPPVAPESAARAPGDDEAPAGSLEGAEEGEAATAEEGDEAAAPPGREPRVAVGDEAEEGGGETPPAPAGGQRPAGVVDDLFARLRSAPRRSRARAASLAAAAAVAEGAAAEAAGAPAAAGPPSGPDPLATRDRLLLPVQNRALRRVKEALVELQNTALDALRVSGVWEGSSDAPAALEAALDAVSEEAAEAGAAAAGAFTGGEAPAPVIGGRGTGLIRDMAAELVAQVDGARAAAAGAGPLEVAAEVGRVFRAWRSEGAERWVRAAAYAAYHDSLLAGLAVLGVKEVGAVASGLLCAECPATRGALWDPGGEPPRGTARPPADPGCVCTVAPA